MSVSAGVNLSESGNSGTSSIQKLVAHPAQRIIKNSLWYIAAGQIERISGIVLSFSLRWGLSPADIGIYSGLRFFLDNTSYSSLGVALGAVQKRPILIAAGQSVEAERLTNIASGTNSITSGVYGAALAAFGFYYLIMEKLQWGIGFALVGIMVILKRRQDFQIAIMRSEGHFQTSSRIAIQVNFAFSILMIVGIYLGGFWGMLIGLVAGFLFQGFLLNRSPDCISIRHEFHFRTACRLAWTGLPILALNSSWMLLGSMDRMMILGVMPDGESQAGYYSIAILATSWCHDIAGRIAIVLYPEYQQAIGKGNNYREIMHRAEFESIMITSVLGLIALWAIPPAQIILPLVFPGLAPGMVVFLPMLTGSLFFSSAWPIRQAMIATGKPWKATIIAVGLVIPQYLILKNACRSQTIYEVAATSTLFQMLATLFLMIIVWSSSKWTKKMAMMRLKYVMILFNIAFGLYISSIVSSTHLLQHPDLQTTVQLICKIIIVELPLISLLLSLIYTNHKLSVERSYT